MSKDRMKIILILIAVLVYYANAGDESISCELNGGECISEEDVSDCTEQHPFRCNASHICCTFNTGNHTDDARPCRNNSVGCVFRGGFCVKQSNTSNCINETVNDTLCDGDQCSCCLPKRDCHCGQAREARIIGGTEVLPKNKYPWMLGIHNAEIERPYVCGATLINDRYALSAAHCFFDSDSKEIPKASIKLGLADHKPSSIEDDVHNVTKLVDIAYYIVHENFLLVPVPTNDIALIKLKEPLDLSVYKEIKPICLPIDKNATYEGKNGIVAGWGISDLKPDPNVLMEVTIPLLDPNCSGLVSGFTEAMLCAGVLKGGKDSCSGDSGGPLIVKEENTYVLVGIVSFGIGCARPLNPGVYTRVTHFLDWINQHTSDAYYCS